MLNGRVCVVSEVFPDFWTSHWYQEDRNLRKKHRHASANVRLIPVDFGRKRFALVQASARQTTISPGFKTLVSFHDVRRVKLEEHFTPFMHYNNVSSQYQLLLPTVPVAWRENGGSEKKKWKMISKWGRSLLATAVVSCLLKVRTCS